MDRAFGKRTLLGILFGMVLAALVCAAPVFAEEGGVAPAGEMEPDATSEMTGEVETTAAPETPAVSETTVEPETPVVKEAETKTDKKAPAIQTGVYKVDGKYRYYKNGKFKAVTGIAKNPGNGKWMYVQKGIFKKKTGVAKRITDGKWLYVKKGIFHKGTGLAKRLTDKQWVFVKKGKVVTDPRKITLTKADKKAKRQEILSKVYAKAIFQKVTKKTMSKKQKMKACFEYVASTKNYTYALNRIPNYHGKDWPIVYTNDMIQYGGSNCFGYSALYGYLAKLCGCKKVYWCTQGYHAWVDIEGRVYDPVFLYNPPHLVRVFGTTYAKTRSMNLGSDFDNSAWRTNPWMRIKVPAF